MMVQKGYTLIEFLVGLVIATLLGIVMTLLFSNVTHQSSTLKDVADIAKNSRTAMFIMARDIANTGYLLNCVGRSCGAMLATVPTPPTTGVGTVQCYFYGDTAASTPPCPSVTYTPPATNPSSPPLSLTLNYAALDANDAIQVKYYVNNNASTLIRSEVHANSTTYPTVISDIAHNVVEMAFKFGLDTTGTVGTGVGVISYSTSMTDLTQLRSIQVALLTRSELPDKKYTAPTTITWLGGSYSVPTDKVHYRFKAVQQEIYILNPTLTSP